jgi:HK97 family phage major capsid protein
MPTRADTIRTRQAEIRTGLDALEALEEPTDEDSLRTDGLLQEWDELVTELEPLAEREQKIAAVRAAMAQESTASRRVTRDPGGGAGPDLIVRQKRDPFADMESVRNGVTVASEVRARALDVVEMYAKRSDHWGLAADGAEQATKLIEKGGKAFGTAVARQMLTTGSPEYLAAFESYLNDPGGYASRAALSLTPANGGYLVPFTLDPTIILTNAGSANPYRRYANVKTTATNDWNGVTSAGVSAEWTGEGTEAADATPTVGQLKITPQKADAYLFGSASKSWATPTSPRSSPTSSPTRRTASRRPRSRSEPAPCSRGASSPAARRRTVRAPPPPAPSRRTCTR